MRLNNKLTKGLRSEFYRDVRRFYKKHKEYRLSEQNDNSSLFWHKSRSHYIIVKGVHCRGWVDGFDSTSNNTILVGSPTHGFGPVEKLDYPFTELEVHQVNAGRNEVGWWSNQDRLLAKFFLGPKYKHDRRLDSPLPQFAWGGTGTVNIPSVWADPINPTIFGNGGTGSFDDGSFILTTSDGAGSITTINNSNSLVTPTAD